MAKERLITRKEAIARVDASSLEQLLFLRPAAGWARYRTPVKGLWMCASGTHPGGGITAGPGRLAALEILRDGN